MSKCLNKRLSKQLSEVMITIQAMEGEFNKVKKTQTEIKLETKNLDAKQKPQLTN